MHLIIKIFSLFVLIFSIASPAPAAELAGKVTRIRAEAEATSAGLTRQLHKDARIYVADTIVTKDNARLEITFTDGSVLTLGAETELKVSEYRLEPDKQSRQTALKLLRGAFLALVKSLFPNNQESRFEVITPDAVMGVRGTQFWGEVKTGFAQVVLLDGKGVYVKNDKGQVELQEAGLGTDVKPGESPTAVKKWGPERVKKAFATVSWD